MFEGKVAAATRLLDSSNNVGGVHASTEDVIESLKGKHPVAESLHNEALVTLMPQNQSFLTTLVEMKSSKQRSPLLALAVHPLLMQIFGSSFSVVTCMELIQMPSALQ